MTRHLGLAVALLVPTYAAAAEIADWFTDFDYFANSWGVVGLKDYPSACRITPDWRLQLADGVEARWLLGAEATPMPRGIKRCLYEGLPVPESHFLVGGTLDYWFTPCAVPLPGRPYDYLKHSRDEDNFVVVASASVRNLTAQPQPARIAVQLQAAGTPLALVPGAPGEAMAEGRVRAVVQAKSGEVRVDGGGTLAVSWDLPPLTSQEVTFYLPYRGLAPGSPEAEWLHEAQGIDQLAFTYDWWARFLRPDRPLVVIPEAKVRDTYFASLAYTFIGRDAGRVHAGEGFYDGFFLRDGAYQVWALEAAGFLDEARVSALDFLNFQKPNGQFESQGGEFDGNGQALWQLVRHYAMTHDEAYLRQVYPAIRRSMEWLTQALKRAPGDPDAAFAGVLPKSWADGEALPQSNYHVVGYDVWNLRGAECAVRAAEALGETQDAAAWRSLAEQYRADLLRLIRQTGAPDLPPTLELAGTDWGNLECIYPTPLLPPFDRRVSATFAQARKTFTEGTIRWCPDTQQVIHPYMSTFITNSDIIRGAQGRAVEGLYAFLLHSTSDHGLPEGVYYPSRTAWGDTVPHLWAAAQYVLLVRNMLVREWQDELHLASAVPDHWLAPGQEVAFLEAPTTFGRAGIRVQAEADRSRVWVTAPRAEGLRRVVVHTPPSIAIEAATPRVGTVRAVSEHSLILAPGNSCVELRITRHPFRRCDYRTAVARYVRAHPRRTASLDGVLGWPLDTPVEAEACAQLDLRPAANTDPFTAPFGTVNPGRYLFTGLSTGRVEVAGIPFEVIDPRVNGGKALVVLQGIGTSTDYPREVQIPVDVTGSRAFFLGQVTGWAPGDPGDPKTGAVGEYVLVYADGKRQVVPLISQQTVDDWATPPTATLTEVGLRGDPWHLSVLAVKLRPVKLTKIIFRDTGTPASPVLAAVTVEAP
ncbi:MAG: hypothetical protein FJX75_10810 [Armatimonadetes bacterium]|nr:hypothetical protein [Armatimonadota bacterium]